MLCIEHDGKETKGGRLKSGLWLAVAGVESQPLVLCSFIGTYQMNVLVDLRMKRLV